ncbi:MAG: DUF177 domain-containing protein [Kiritimatiellae bacterium]|nr:DUF177 domain-containing protein [Verrucomicrobiota bacterium]MBU4365667.1 DUF177 domain-containing protein [Verrucomicrobiota bacterium]MCG2658838.1 DUF177 domain-containing protein [Kiritimatiellia bacterium]
MNIETGQVRQRPRRFTGVEPSAILELPQETQFQVIGDVRYALTAQRFAADLLVRGVLEMDVRGRCARCGEYCTQTVRDGAFACSYSLSAANELIDLTADIREAILLALPMNFVCSEACRGLCVQCGANLNKAPCACAKPRQTIPWGMLDQLKLKRK